MSKIKFKEFNFTGNLKHTSKYHIGIFSELLWINKYFPSKKCLCQQALKEQVTALYSEVPKHITNLTLKLTQTKPISGPTNNLSITDSTVWPRTVGPETVGPETTWSWTFWLRPNCLRLKCPWLNCHWLKCPTFIPTLSKTLQGQQIICLFPHMKQDKNRMFQHYWPRQGKATLHQ